MLDANAADGRGLPWITVDFGQQKRPTRRLLVAQSSSRPSYARSPTASRAAALSQWSASAG